MQRPETTVDSPRRSRGFRSYLTCDAAGVVNWYHTLRCATHFFSTGCDRSSHRSEPLAFRHSVPTSVCSVMFVCWKCCWCNLLPIIPLCCVFALHNRMALYTGLSCICLPLFGVRVRFGLFLPNTVG